MHHALEQARHQDARNEVEHRDSHGRFSEGHGDVDGTRIAAAGENPDSQQEGNDAQVLKEQDADSQLPVG